MGPARFERATNGLKVCDFNWPPARTGFGTSKMIRRWSQTKDHERWDGIKLDRPEAMPVLGTRVLHGTLGPSQNELFDSIGRDVTF